MAIAAMHGSARRMRAGAPARQVPHRKTAADQHKHTERESAGKADRIDARQEVAALDRHAPDFRMGHQ